MSVWSEPGRALLFVRNVPAVGVCLSVTLSHTEVCDMRTAGGIRGRIRQRDASQKGAAGGFIGSVMMFKTSHLIHAPDHVLFGFYF